MDEQDPRKHIHIAEIAKEHREQSQRRRRVEDGRRVKLLDVERELDRMLDRFGIDMHSPHEFVALLAKVLGQVAGATVGSPSPALYRHELITLAALAVSALERHDRYSEEHSAPEPIWDVPPQPSPEEARRALEEECVTEIETLPNEVLGNLDSLIGALQELRITEHIPALEQAMALIEPISKMWDDDDGHDQPMRINGMTVGP